jgi:WD40 repeat protein
MVQDDMGISDLKNPPRSETRVRSLALPPQLTGATTHIAAPSTAASNSSAQGSAALQQQGYNFLFTAGTDKKIRYWDLANPRNSYVLCGLEKDEPRPVYSSRNVDGVEVIEELPGAAVDAVRAYDDPAYREPNLDPPPMAHRDTILSLNIIESPSRMLVSASRDGAIKVWK